MTEQELAEQLRPGVVFIYHADVGTLDDPATAQRWKYAVVVRHAATSCWFFYTTSQGDAYARNPYLMRDVLVIPASSYGWTVVDTYIAVRSPKKLDLSEMAPLAQQGELKLLAPLRQEHVEALLAKVAASSQLSPLQRRALLGNG